MDLAFENYQKLLSNDSSKNPVNSLVNHRKNLLNSIKDELYYANVEIKLINHLFSLNNPPGENDQSTSDSDQNGTKQTKLLKFGSNDYYETQDDWRNVLNDSFDHLMKSVKQRASDSKQNLDLDRAYEQMSRLQNTYFTSVQQRENNMKLLLRLKMYTNNRLKLLEDSLKSYETMAEYKPLYNEPVDKQDKSNTPRYSFKTVLKNKVDSDYLKLVNSKLNIETPELPKQPLKKPNSYKFVSNVLPVFKTPYSSSLLNIFYLTNSLDEFKASAKTIYQKYGKNYMTFNVFNNLALYLIQSLHMPNLNRIPTDHIYEVYNVNSRSILDFRTFTILYWEILHALRKAVELYYHPQYAFHPDDMHLNLAIDDSYPFVNISDYYSFIKRLSPGKSCNKYVAKELDTNELRVVELFCKAPDMPLFHEIYSEVEHLKKLNHKNLVKYIALYHDYNTVYVVTEFCSELSLLNKMHTLDSNSFDYSLEFVHNVFTQVVEALVFLHCNNITLNCLNPDKVMLDDSSALPKIKVRCYGLMDMFENYKYDSFLTTLHRAPEVVDGNFSRKSDVWSLGIMLFFMLTGQMPTPNLKKTPFVEQLPHALANSRLFDLDDDVVDLTCYMLSYDPNLRPTSFDIVSHPWYNATNLPKKSANTKYLTRYVHALSNMNNYRNISKFLESKELFYVNRLNKIMNTLLLSSEPNDNELVSYGNFLKVLKMERVPSPLISELVQLTSLKDSDKCSLKEFFVACKYWRYGEINILWSICKKAIDERDWSLNKGEFNEILHESKTALVTKNEINELCRSVSVDNKIYWNHFVNLFY